MKPCTHARLRPWLGTFTEIRLQFSAGADAATVQQLFSAGFDAIAAVHQRFSKFSALSELSAINRMACGHRLELSEPMRRVLQLAFRLCAGSDCAFDPCAGNGRPLTATLEMVGSGIARIGEGTVDLGGIAKGFAVDQAIDAIEAHARSLPRLSQPTDITVNAGGDLRHRGAAAQWVSIRALNPRNPPFSSVHVKNQAVATSVLGARGDVLPLAGTVVDRHAARGSDHRSVTVACQTTMMADALAKVALLKGAGHPLLAACGAQVLLEEVVT